MKAYQIGEKPGLDRLSMIEQPMPRPGPGQVLLKMKAWSINYRDLQVVKGLYGSRPTANIVPLSDGVGEVVELGDGVGRVRAGDRVAGIFMQDYLGGELNALKAKSALGGGLEGLLAEYVVLSEQGVVPVPEHLNDEEAATLPCAGVTAWNAVIAQGGVRPGQTVLTLGTGGVSVFALQFAKMAGARVIITSKSDEKLARARKLGADETINYVRDSIRTCVN